MPWWQSPFSNKSHSDDSLLGGRYNNLKPSIFSRRTNRQLAASKKVRPFAEHGFEQPTGPSSGSRTGTPTSGGSALPEPHPLPLPELQCCRTNHSNILSTKANSVYSRSPDDVVGLQLDRGRGRDNNKVIDAKFGRFSCEEDGRILEPYSAGRSTVKDYVGYNAHRSAPTSPFASPRNSSPLRGRVSHDGGRGGDVDVKDKFTYQNIRSPLRGRMSQDGGLGGDVDGKDTFTSQYTSVPGCFQFYSAPEMLSSSYGESSNSSSISLNRKVSSEYDDGSPPFLSPLPLPTSTYSQRLSHSQCPSPSISHVHHPLPLPPPTSSHSQHPHLSPIQEIQPVNSQWQKGKLLGRGTFGSVYVASNRETGALCAMKEVDMVPDDSKSAESIKQLEQEIKVLRHLKHSNIVQYYGCEIVGDRFYIYLEYVHPGSLTRFIKDHCGGITEAVVRNFTRHILCGLAYLHSTKTIHRDIKGANLLVDAYGVVKLADFGMAKHLQGHNAHLSLKGSPYWMAPELLQSVISSNANSDDALAVDIWSLGCTVIEMLTGAPPWSEYEGAAAMFKVLQENPPIPADLSQDGKDFLNCCFKRNPTERPTAAMLLEHRFVRGNLQAHDAPINSAKRPFAANDSLLSRRGHQEPMLSDTQNMKGKALEHNEMSHRCNKEGANLWDASPRSTLDCPPSLSPPHPGYDHLCSPIQKGGHTPKKQ